MTLSLTAPCSVDTLQYPRCILEQKGGEQHNMVETLERPSTYTISTVNDNRFVTAEEIASKLREQQLSMCNPDSCVVDYRDSCGQVEDQCLADY